MNCYRNLAMPSASVKWPLAMVLLSLAAWPALAEDLLACTVPVVGVFAVPGFSNSGNGQNQGQAFAVLKDPSVAATDADALKLEGAIMKVVDDQLGAVARPARVRFVSVLPKTRSGKLLRRAIQAVCEGRDPGDLTTMDDPSALQQIVDLVKA